MTRAKIYYYIFDEWLTGTEHNEIASISLINSFITLILKVFHSNKEIVAFLMSIILKFLSVIDSNTA